MPRMQPARSCRFTEGDDKTAQKAVAFAWSRSSTEMRRAGKEKKTIPDPLWDAILDPRRRRRRGYNSGYYRRRYHGEPGDVPTAARSWPRPSRTS